MKHIGTKYLETKRLILRKFLITDASAMFKNWASDIKVTKYLTWEPHNSIDVTKGVLEDWIDRYSQNNFYQWAIVLKENPSEPIGCIGINYFNEVTGTAHFGYCLGQPWWNLGIMTEALQCIIEFMLDEVKVLRIESKHDPRNIASGIVMQKCGMKYEGTLRLADKNNQGICDACYYSVLQSERE